MIRIALCDSDSLTLSSLLEFVNQYADERRTAIDHVAFESTVELISGMKGGEYDVILLNALMPVLSGIQAAHEIRNLDKNVKIIFLTSSSEIVADSYAVSACFYAPKPITTNILFPLLDRVLADIELYNETGFVLKCKTGVTRIPFARLEYVEVMNKRVSFHMSDGSTFETHGTLSDFEPNLLIRPGFIKVHRSYILNMRHIKSLTYQSVLTQAGKLVPISRSLYRQVRNAYTGHLPVPAQDIPPSTNSISQRILPENDAYRILLVDDEPEQQRHWSELLIKNGCTVQNAADGHQAMCLAKDNKFDCVILDVMLGSDSGFSLCQSLHSITGAPVVFLSSLNDSDSQLQGFACGGFDYITKDTPGELFWVKIKTRIQLSHNYSAPLCFGPLSIDFSQGKAFMNGSEILFTPIELDFLSILVRHPQKVYSLEALHQTVWGNTGWDDGQIVQVHMSHMRRKLEKAYAAHSFIETVWGKGYRFVPINDD